MTIATRSTSRARTTTGDDDHEQIVIRHDRRSGMRLIIAVHSTVLGPALGGLRLKRYAGGLREALEDVMGLARTMTLKASAAGLDLGGGKAVMIDDGATSCARRGSRQPRARSKASAARTSPPRTSARPPPTSTTWPASPASAPAARSANGGGGDPSPVTAATVLAAMRRGLAAQTGSDELDGRRVGLIGLGKVGGALATALAAAGAQGARVRRRSRPRRQSSPTATASSRRPRQQAILAGPLDVLAPCAARRD